MPLSSVSYSIQIRRQATRSQMISMAGARQRLNSAIAQKIVQLTRMNFGPVGMYRPSPWPAYSKEYARRNPGPPTLYRRGVLFRSLQWSANAATATVSAEGDKDYAAAHQFGNSNVPARPYFPIEQRGAGYEVTWSASKQIERELDAEVTRILGGP